jgi:AcrR family transcriptional regulator
LEPSRARARTAPRRGGVREEHRILTRQRLMDAGLACFEKLGYGSTTVEDIVAEAEVARGTFYLHFNNKLELVRAWTEDVQPAVGELYERLDQMLAKSDRPDRKAIRAWMKEAFAWFTTHHTIVAVWHELAITEPSFQGVSPFLTADHMPLYLGQWPKRRREAARIRIVLLVQQLSAAFQLTHMNRLLDVRDEFMIDVLTDLWMSALTRADIGSVSAPGGL